ncbi:MAG: hypothetical protein WDN00_09745 [Limisphaerales bacterium]
MKKLSILLAAACLVAFSSSIQAQDHGHLNIGAVGTDQNDPLTFDNGSDFVTDSDYVFTLVYTNGGTYSNYYQGNITMTALAATTAHSGPDSKCTCARLLYLRATHRHGGSGGWRVLVSGNLARRIPPSASPPARLARTLGC